MTDNDFYISPRVIKDPRDGFEIMDAAPVYGSPPAEFDRFACKLNIHVADGQAPNGRIVQLRKPWIFLLEAKSIPAAFAEARKRAEEEASNGHAYWVSQLTGLVGPDGLPIAKEPPQNGVAGRLYAG